eukprot:CAMPEP_0168524176 /NCGR_PEP_ID=MMETSP0405-20121227/10477_1 /TAXON_ID=498012 /ORGANISM="Trichosphaerium sp, Strain Am-I-7 wt" /LENGTH=129 /DNA_ID=CAMNT_0008546299 /DNA_START=406 /DNA_END=792 /DNA_ORIENTATION=-
MWTNTCCSHPLHYPEEMETQDHIGVKRAISRKVDHELGIKGYKTDNMHFITRILYKSASDPIWGEHELDYVVIAKDNNDVKVDPNKNEVRAVEYMNKKNLRNFIDTAEEKNVLLTPWFKIIADNFLFKW